MPSSLSQSPPAPSVQFYIKSPENSLVSDAQTFLITIPWGHLFQKNSHPISRTCAGRLYVLNQMGEQREVVENLRI